MANDISETQQIVDVIIQDGAVRQKMSKRGFDTEKLTTGSDLCEAAQQAWDGRQDAMSAQEKQTGVVTKLADDARKAYSDFREVARTEFKDEASLTALSISEEVPGDLQTFLTHARSAYTAAKKPEYQGKLKEVGYGPAELKNEIDALDALQEAAGLQTRLIGDAQQATDDRNKAVKPLREYRTNLLKIARRVFRRQPAQLRKLDI